MRRCALVANNATLGLNREMTTIAVALAWIAKTASMTDRPRFTMALLASIALVTSITARAIHRCQETVPADPEVIIVVARRLHPVARLTALGLVMAQVAALDADVGMGSPMALPHHEPVLAVLPVRPMGRRSPVRIDALMTGGAHGVRRGRARMTTHAVPLLQHRGRHVAGRIRIGVARRALEARTRQMVPVREADLLRQAHEHAAAQITAVVEPRRDALLGRLALVDLLVTERAEFGGRQRQLLLAGLHAVTHLAAQHALAHVRAVRKPRLLERWPPERRARPDDDQRRRDDSDQAQMQVQLAPPWPARTAGVHEVVA